LSNKNVKEMKTQFSNKKTLYLSMNPWKELRCYSNWITL